MRVFRLIQCRLQHGHKWKLSQSMPGHITCVRCLTRRKLTPEDTRKIEIVAE